MGTKRASNTMKTVGLIALALAIVAFFLNLKVLALSDVWELCFVGLLVLGYHCWMRVIMNSALDEFDEYTKRAKTVRVVSIVLGLLSFILILFPSKRLLAALIVLVITAVFTLQDFLYIKKCEGEQASAEEDNDILNDELSRRLAREEGKAELQSQDSGPRRKAIVLNPNGSEDDTAKVVAEERRAFSRRVDATVAGQEAEEVKTAGAGEISAEDALAAMAGLSAALKAGKEPKAEEPVAKEPAVEERAGEEPVVEEPAAEPEKKPFVVKIPEEHLNAPAQASDWERPEHEEPEEPDTYVDPVTTEVAEPAYEEKAEEAPVYDDVTSSLSAKMQNRKARKAAKARKKADRAAAQLEAAEEFRAERDAAIEKYGNARDADTYMGLAHLLKQNDPSFEPRDDDEPHYIDEMFVFPSFGGSDYDFYGEDDEYYDDEE